MLLLEKYTTLLHQKRDIEESLAHLKKQVIETLQKIETHQQKINHVTLFLRQNKEKEQISFKDKEGLLSYLQEQGVEKKFIEVKKTQEKLDLSYQFERTRVSLE